MQPCGYSMILQMWKLSLAKFSHIIFISSFVSPNSIWLYDCYLKVKKNIYSQRIYSTLLRKIHRRNCRLIFGPKCEGIIYLIISTIFNNLIHMLSGVLLDWKSQPMSGISRSVLLEPFYDGKLYDWKNNEDKTYKCPRDWRLSATWEINWGSHLNPLIRYCCNCLGGFRGAINCYTSERCCFPSSAI